MAEILNYEQLLDEDIERIYLGNLKTVEADIEMPTEGKNGSVYTWESEKAYIFAPDGKVTRPQFGAGNREVKLTLTATLGGVTKTKVFVANVLQREYPSTVVSSYPITVYTPVGVVPHLPGIAVIHNNLDEDAVLPIEWEPICPEMVKEKGSFVHTAPVKDGVSVEATIVVTDDENLLCPKHEIEKAVELFSLGDVRLCDGSTFKDRQDGFKGYLLSVCDDTMLHCFRTVSGLDTKGAKPNVGWDSPDGNLRGHTTGHYLSGLALCYAATGDKEIKAKLDYMVESLAECQQANTNQPEKFKPGFLFGSDESQFDLLEVYTVYPIIWAPYYTLHKIMAGLRDCYLHADSELAFDVLKKVGLWVYNRLINLPKTQLTKMWSMYIAGEFGGINESLADLYMLTGDERYLEASRLFDNDKLYLPMEMGVDALGNLHANQHIPQIVGVMRQFDATKEADRWSIANNFWKYVTSDHAYSIGGTGETEMFKPARQIVKYISEKTAESCATYNMLKLTGMLYQYNAGAEYMHYYERAVTNHINACGDPSGPTGGSTYFMPTLPGGQKGFDCTENTCCHGTGHENHFKYGEYIYAKDKDSVIVNLFIPSVLNAENDKLSVATAVGKDTFTVTVKIDALSKESLKVRKPIWASDVAATVDGKEEIPCEVNGYYVFDTAKEIVLEFICKGYLFGCVDDEKTASVCWGPYVLSAINDSKEYLSLDVSYDDVAEKLVNNGDGSFTLCGEKFVPFNTVDQEHYHLYVKVK